MTDKVRRALLEKMRPDSLVAEDAPWQQRKSGETRLRLLEATIDCLVENGYAGLSANAVTMRSGVSRGAMHHHFPSRMALVAAVIEYILYQRLERFLADCAEISAADPAAGPEAAMAAAEVYWRDVQTREYAAYVELAVAARTDAELEAHFTPAARKLDDIWFTEMKRSFPNWRQSWELLRAASDFSIAAHLGLLMQQPIISNADRTRAVLDLIAKTIRMVHTDNGE